MRFGRALLLGEQFQWPLQYYQRCCFSAVVFWYRRHPPQRSGQLADIEPEKETGSGVGCTDEGSGKKKK
jgi:hypothetical protein